VQAVQRALSILLVLLAFIATGMQQSHAADSPAADAVKGGASGTPLVVGNRTIHVFLASLGDFTAAERAEAARRHIERALESSGEGWTSVVPAEQGFLVRLDDQPMFTVLPGDARKHLDETPEDIANHASRTLQRVWAESAERRNAGLNAIAVLKAGLALAALGVALLMLTGISGRLHAWTATRLARPLARLSGAGLGPQLPGLFLRLLDASRLVLAWTLGFVAVLACVIYVLKQFALTRPAGESLATSFLATVQGGLESSANALPGLFVAAIIFLLARLATRASRAVFDRIVAGHLRLGPVDAHTAPATRHLVNGGIWLFALAMSYPYLPGSHTEAFKGVSVLVGLIVSIGASGLVGQIASGVILVYTRALLLGEYVRIQDCEGTVTEMGLCVTRLRTGTGEDIALPNSLVLSHVTRNYSRNVGAGGFILDSTVTIGYDTPWRQVHAMLLEAASRIPAVRTEPAPFVLQTALSDFYVEYRLVVQVGPESAAVRPRVLGDLNAAIQDVFNRHGVQIMSPHYRGDPDTPKVVPESAWRPQPARPDS
jgi:small-conductance mechanosensitive channel